MLFMMKQASYLCLPCQRFDMEEYSLISIREQDMESIRQWRNAQILILRQQIPISALQQQIYYQEQIRPSLEQEQPKQILFSFLMHDRLIGYGGLTYIDWIARRGEVSFLLNPEIDGYADQFFNFLGILTRIAFKTLKFHRLFAETFAFRSEHITVLELAGFILEGRLRDHIFKEGRWHDSLIHGLLEKEFNAR